MCIFTTLMNNMLKYWAIVPFYSKENDLDSNIIKLTDTIDSLIKKCWVEICYVLNDSPNINLQSLIWWYENDKLNIINMPNNQWKTWAVKAWIEYILNNHKDIQYIIQSDFDKEQNPWDAELFKKYIESKKDNNEANTEKLLLIWDRYRFRAEETNWNWWNNSYRKNVLDAQSLLCQSLWVEWVQDLTSWLRMYSASLAKDFILKWKWDWFASDLDQFIIACLEWAKIDSVSLNRGKERDTYTYWRKLIQVFNWILCHREELIENGKAGVVKLFENIVNWLKRQDEKIKIDLWLIWWKKIYYYVNNWDDKYSLTD